MDLVKGLKTDIILHLLERKNEYLSSREAPGL